MNIDLTVELKDLAGNKIPDGDGFFTLGKALGNIVAGADVGGKMKLFILGTKLFQEKTITVDDADLALIKSAVEATNVYPGSLIPGQCAQLLEEVKK